MKLNSEDQTLKKIMTLVLNVLTLESRTGELVWNDPVSKRFRPFSHSEKN